MEKRQGVKGKRRGKAGRPGLEASWEGRGEWVKKGKN